ncbi:MAG: protein kinase [Planctomycetes bacterium]|nr:protein kinase [Planctomycetota bacterium]
MSSHRGDLLFGRLALHEGLITREQVNDCLAAQERNPARPLGAIMVARGYLREEDVQRLLAMQQRIMSETTSHGRLLGRILIERGLATEFQVHECLRLQGRLIDLDIRPIPRLGEIMIRHGYLTKEALETALQFQNLELYCCPDCGARIQGGSGLGDGEAYTCSQCGAEIPFLFAKMAAGVHEALQSTSKRLELALLQEVRTAAAEPSNHFGKYLLIEEIGRGGAGIVYRAWQKDLNRAVALKMLPHESDTAAGIRTPYGDAEDLKRFYNETRAVAELSHPNIVPILDFGTVENHYYYTMELIKGVTLERLLREGRKCALLYPFMNETFPERGLPPSFAAALLRDVCRAIHFAHERGIFHRDLKPSNILIDGEGRPHVMDFGLAKLRHLGDSAYVMGVVMGTPYYMPPEQAEGDMERVDNASDVYSLGAVLYEMISGRSPYIEQPTDKVLERVRSQPPAPIEALAPRAPEPLCKIIRRAMQHRKEDRYPSAAAMADDLQRFLDGVALSAKRPWPPARTIWARLKGLLRRGGGRRS